MWGGGLREKEAFWDECDRRGIMGWQEFPLACDFFDHYAATPDYLDTLTSEAEGIILALRGHPSLIAWCGGNEIDTERENAPLRCIITARAEYDPARPWIPASPSQGDLHQWNVWHGQRPWSELAETAAPFMSEFGLQALPDLATLQEMFPTGIPANWGDRRWRRAKRRSISSCTTQGKAR